MMNIAEPAKREPYERPELRVHGTLESITQTTLFPDGNLLEGGWGWHRRRWHWPHDPDCYS